MHAVTGDLELLERHAPILRFSEGEYFLPASVEAFVERSQLWVRTGPTTRELVADTGTLDVDRLVALTRGHRAEHYLRLVDGTISASELVSWRLRKDRPRFRAETRLGQVGVAVRMVDAFARASLLFRGRVPSGAEATAAIADRDRPDHGDHPYYGRVVRDAGYVTLQYWYFYFFNDWRTRAHGVNDHEGDWEQVTIFLSERPGGDLAPAWVAFSAHETVGADLRRRWDDPDLTLVDGHPVVHPGLGSHAGAYLPGEYLITVHGSHVDRLLRASRRVSRFVLPWRRERATTSLGMPYVEYARGDGVAIGHGQADPWRPVVIDDDTPWVAEYTGLWGDDTNDRFGGERGPAGPRYERDGTLRRSWSDPVGWAALDPVVPDAAAREAVVTARIAELDDELVQLAREREELRNRVRAAVVGGATDIVGEQQQLADLARSAAARGEERRQLETARRAEPVPTDPHAHLHHRKLPLPQESSNRRRLLRVWATVSTPLVFVLLALLFLPLGVSIYAGIGVCLLFLLLVEAVARRRTVAFLLGLAGFVVMAAVTVVVAVALVANWRYTVAGLLCVAAVAFLVLNLREIRRT